MQNRQLPRIDIRLALFVGWMLASAAGCQQMYSGAQYDRPFPLGSVSDAFWETQQTNAEAADFVFYHHDQTWKGSRLVHGGCRMYK